MTGAGQRCGAGEAGKAGADDGDLHFNGFLLAPGRGVSHLNEMVELLVWYDGACPLCRREIALMRRLDRRRAINFVDVAEAGGSCPIDRAALLARFHAREDGRMLSGAAAFAAMWRAIPLLRPLGLAARSPLVLAGLERTYLLFLKVRPRLQQAMRGRMLRPARS